MRYEFELNLQRLAMISKAVSLWEEEETKNQVREFFINGYSTWSSSKQSNENKWRSIIKQVLTKLEPNILPAMLASKLEYVVRSIGEKIYNWYEYIDKQCQYTGLERKTGYSDIQKIYWTPYGNIDEVRILEELLQHITIFNKAISVWEREEVKNKIRELYIYKYKNNGCDDIGLNENLNQYVIQQLEQIILPQVLNSELISVGRVIGERIYKRYECEQQYKNVCLTQEIVDDDIQWWGIDEVKYKVNDLQLFTYNLACSYCLKEDINGLWEQIPQKIQDKYYEDIYKKYEQHILAYWECYRDGDLPELIRYFNMVRSDYDHVYNVNYSIEENMFKLSVRQGYSLAMRYFWHKLTDEEKERNIVDSARMAIKKSIQYNNDIGNYAREQHTDISSFLMSKMQEGQNQELFKSYGVNLLDMFLSYWPWQEFLMPTLERIWDYLGVRDYQYLLNEIVGKMYHDHELGYVVENSRYQRILHEVWHKSPVYLKQWIDQNSKNIIDTLLNIEDISTLHLIINDPDIAARRQELIDRGYKKYKDWILQDKYELVDQFIEQVLTKEEEKAFKYKINIWHCFIIGNYSATIVDGNYSDFKIIGESRDRYDLADKLLDWQCNSVEERQELKDRIDHIKVCYYFIAADRCNLADKFLGWCLKSAEEIRNCKNGFKDNQFSVDHLYRLWVSRKEDVEIVQEKSSKFLHWFLESEEEIACFKQEKLINEKLQETLEQLFIGRAYFEIIDDFLAWCLLSTEEIQRIKQIIVDKTIWQKCEYCIAGGGLDMAERSIKWAFDTEVKRQDFIKQLMISDDGVTSCHSLIRSISDVEPDNPKPSLEERVSKFNQLIDFWLKPLDEIHIFKGQMQSYESYYHDEEQRENYQIFMKLLDSRYYDDESMEVSYTGESSNMNM